jgi:hypothetical protein
VSDRVRFVTLVFDRRPARRGRFVLRPYVDDAPASADLCLLAPALQSAATLQGSLDRAAEYCATHGMDPRWAALLSAFFDRDEPCVPAARPPGTRALLAPGQLELVFAGYAALARAARSGARAGAYHAVCPEELIDAWAVLVHLGHEWLEQAARAFAAQQAEGRAVRWALLDTDAEAAAAEAARAARGEHAHRVGGALAGPAPRCTCGATLEVQLWLDARDPALALAGVPGLGAGLPLLFCAACDAMWNDPLLCYALGDGAVVLLAQPAGCRRERPGGRPREVPCDLRAQPPTVGATDGTVYPDGAPDPESPDHRCPRCAAPMPIFAALGRDAELELLPPQARTLRFRLCRACGVVEAEAVPPD